MAIYIPPNRNIFTPERISLREESLLQLLNRLSNHKPYPYLQSQGNAFIILPEDGFYYSLAGDLVRKLSDGLIPGSRGESLAKTIMTIISPHLIQDQPDLMEDDLPKINYLTQLPFEIQVLITSFLSSLVDWKRVSRSCAALARAEEVRRSEFEGVNVVEYLRFQSYARLFGYRSDNFKTIQKIYTIIEKSPINAQEYHLCKTEMAYFLSACQIEDDGTLVDRLVEVMSNSRCPVDLLPLMLDIINERDNLSKERKNDIFFAVADELFEHMLLNIDDEYGEDEHGVSIEPSSVNKPGLLIAKLFDLVDMSLFFLDNPERLERFLNCQRSLVEILPLFDPEIDFFQDPDRSHYLAGLYFIKIGDLIQQRDRELMQCLIFNPNSNYILDREKEIAVWDQMISSIQDVLHPYFNEHPVLDKEYLDRRDTALHRSVINGHVRFTEYLIGRFPELLTVRNLKGITAFEVRNPTAADDFDGEEPPEDWLDRIEQCRQVVEAARVERGIL